jgi:RNA polymerase sigma-70 factor (ECF subfamily)
MDKNDEELIEDYLSGDSNSLKIIIDKYTNAIYNFVSRFVERDIASDITQDIFIKVWKNLKKFNKKKAIFKTWIFTIARNTVIDYLRKKKAITFSDLDREDEIFGENIQDENLLPDELLMKIEDEDNLKKVLENLPSNYKEVLILHHQEDLTFSEISKILNKPLNTIKSYHYRAILKLKELILHQN